MADITVMELDNRRLPEIQANPIAFVNDILERLRRGGNTQQTLWGRFVFTSHADEKPAVSWRQFAEVFKSSSTVASTPNQEAIITIIELNHNGWMNIQRDALTFVSVICERMKQNSGSSEWIVGGRIVFTGPVNEEPIPGWRQFAESQLVN
jgi:hypothetical protein